MELYSKKTRWKVFLAILGILIIAASLFFTSQLVNEFAKNERDNVKLWARTVHRKARLVRYTDILFKQLRASEKQKVELLADVYKRLLRSNNSQDLNFYLKILNQNDNIPVVVVSPAEKIVFSRNLLPGEDTTRQFRGKIKESFSIYPPIVIPVVGQKTYYRNSLFYNQLQSVLDDLVTTFMSEVTANSASVPVIITDSTKTHILQYGNLNDVKMRNPVYAASTLKEMKSQNPPIEINFSDLGRVYIFYKSSDLLTKMKWFPLIQILIVGFFLIIAYLLFSASRRSEQNQVWVGMAKETAHQIGTPLSSILAWAELMKMDKNNVDQASIEITKDVKRLEIITERFSKIGSTPNLDEDNLTRIIYETIDYLKPRTPSKVSYLLNFPKEKEIILPVNASLFSWVLENLCKNSIDAMSGKGTITIDLHEENKQAIVDVTDTGKGISLSEQKSIFNPGYTSKKRGWGLGLTLAKRIIQEYHKGKIFIKNTSSKGTTFRIVLKKDS
ncbi:MAG: HAMP domain-containing histidine kinase [Bacteroidales bacterium]|nr:HAMP domain-containing histidine kinase [Bacteroidales bacterium]